MQVYDVITCNRVRLAKSTVNPSKQPTSPPVSPSPTSTLCSPAPTPPPILEGVRDIFEWLREVLADVELRMVEGSALIVYEGEEKRAGACVRWLERWLDMTFRIRACAGCVVQMCWQLRDGLRGRGGRWLSI